MTKKWWFWVVIILIVIILGVLYFHFTPVWASITSIISGAAGVVIGWVGHILYKRYIKPTDIEGGQSVA